MAKNSPEKRENLTSKRIEKKLTRPMLAKKVGVSAEHIKSLEYGRVNPSFKLLVKICDALDSKADELF